MSQYFVLPWSVIGVLFCLAYSTDTATLTVFWGINAPTLARPRADGYDCVALNTIFYGRIPKEHSCTVEPIRFDPGPVDSRRKRREPSLLRSRGGGGIGGGEAPLGYGATAESGPDQLTRLTVVLEDDTDAHVLSAGSEVLQTYDIVAAVPDSPESFELICCDSDVDIISIPFGNRLPFTIYKKMTDAALARGAVFEITYSHAIKSSMARKNLIGNVQALITFTRGRGIILTSGAEMALHARNPHDVANLGQMLGLTQEQSIRAVSDTPLAVVRRAEARKGRFRGISIGQKGGFRGSADAALESLQIPKEFYLPEAAPSEGKEESSKGEGGEGAGEENEGFLSFGGGSMDVET